VPLPPPLKVTTARGDVLLRALPEVVLLRRHGEDRYYPPHRIPHHAHVLAMENLGAGIALGLTSTGSLDPDLQPGDVIIPDDYFSRHAPPTFCEDEPLHIVPELDPEGRAWLREAARRACEETGGQVVDGGVYAETRGPRFETKAEIRSLARDASVVGMTLASEATLFQERGIRYAALCVVDNWANGVGREPLTLESFRQQQAANATRVRKILENLLLLWRGHNPS